MTQQQRSSTTQHQQYNSTTMLKAGSVVTPKAGVAVPPSRPPSPKGPRKNQPAGQGVDGADLGVALAGVALGQLST